MALLTTNRSPAQRLGPGLIYLFLIGIVGIVVATALSGQGSFELVVLVAAATMAVTAAVRWEWGIYAVLFYVCVEGAVSNLLSPQTYPVLIKDAIIACLYVGCFLKILSRRDKWPLPRQVLLPMLVFALICVIESFNPNLTTQGTNGLAVAGIGFRVLIFYMPLFFVGTYLAMRRPNILQTLTRYCLILSIPITSFGIFEYFLGYKYFIGYQASQSVLGPLSKGFLYVGQEQAGSSNALIVRVASTFSFTGFFGAFLFFMVVLALASFLQAETTRGRTLAATALVINAIGFIVQSQRTNWVLLPVVMTGVFLINRTGTTVIKRLPWLIGAGILADTVGGSVVSDRFTSLVASFGAHVNNGSNQITDSLFSTTALFGSGTGSGLGAARYISGQQVPAVFEGGWGVPLFMLGIWGVGALLWIYTAIVRLAWEGMHEMDPNKRWLPLSVLCWMVVTAIDSGSINYPPQNIYFWLFGGILCGPALVSRRRKDQERSAANG